MFSTKRDTLTLTFGFTSFVQFCELMFNENMVLEKIIKSMIFLGVCMYAYFVLGDTLTLSLGFIS